MDAAATVGGVAAVSDGGDVLGVVIQTPASVRPSSAALTTGAALDGSATTFVG